MTSVRRGAGSDVAGSRPYGPGDDAHSIDWAASARLSSAHGSDEFIVREYLAEEAPRVVVLSDRRPAMSLFPKPLPWLDKPEAMRHAAGLVAEATLAARGFFGYLDLGREGDDDRWVPPRTHHELPEQVGGVALPFHDHTTGRFVSVRLTDREAAWMREENERRAADLLARFRTLDLGPVLVTTSDRGDIFQAFLEWADERIVSRGHWW